MATRRIQTTRLSLEYLRDLGYHVDVVERWTGAPGGGAQIKRDLFGILDLVAVRDGQTVGVQTTTKDHMAVHATKIVESEHIGALWAAGWHIVVHGWWLYEPPPGGGHGRKHYEVEELEVVPVPTQTRFSDADARPTVDITRSL